MTQQERIEQWLRKHTRCEVPIRAARAIVEERVNPAEAAVMLLKESGGGRNVFGCDYGHTGGRPPYCGEKVTFWRVQRLRLSGKRNGIGPCQLTHDSWVTRKPSTWLTVHRPLVSMKAAFRGWKEMRHATSMWMAARAYNGGADYADDFIKRFGGVARSMRGAGIVL